MLLVTSKGGNPPNAGSTTRRVILHAFRFRSIWSCFAAPEHLFFCRAVGKVMAHCEVHGAAGEAARGYL